MRMGMGTKLGLSLKIALKCPLCDSDSEEHKPGCLYAELERYRLTQRYLTCPTCRARKVGVNSSDFYECRDCHTQYSRGIHPEHDQNKTLLDDPIEADMFWVVTLSEKGQGDFPIDKAIERVNAQIQTKLKELGKDKDGD